MKSIFALTTFFFCISLTHAQEYDADFWDSWDEDIPPYKHNWVDIPDMINKTEWRFWFHMTNQFLTGVERGIYDNQNITLHKDCFGERYITKINELRAMSI